KMAGDKNYPDAAYQAGLLENQGVKLPSRNVTKKTAPAVKKNNAGKTVSKKETPKKTTTSKKRK
ncbi:MAG: hypothetical protein K2M39_00205, partial [Muribaculaceae bacterium]|nr:hypothetical protein [Muribaculaceae bacterium]